MRSSAAQEALERGQRAASKPALFSRQNIITVLALLAACLALPGSAAAADLFDPIGPVLAAQAWHLVRVTLIGVFVVTPPLVLIVFVIWRYRIGGSSSSYWPTWEFNGFYETAIWAGPLVVVGFLGIWLVSSTVELDPYAPLPGADPLRIDLVGLDDKWLALYPDERVAALNEIVLPVGRPVTFRITSDTVMQSFLPQGFAGQIYLMPGMVTELNLAASEPGEGKAIQTQYNGSGFANQRVPMRAVSEADFETWVTSASGEPLTADRYPTLISSGKSVEEFQMTKAALMPLADDCLFERVVARYHQNAQIPVAAQPGSPTYDPEAAPLPAGACGALLPEGFTPGGMAMGSGMAKPMAGAEMPGTHSVGAHNAGVMSAERMSGSE
ncbi:MAG: cytochrome ubiquinol oxidase subunit II [Fulvimarina manganoxydans]|uniref:cytochrome ubiquinol oxidase subunit II n=1 Tax=Fulvimarina manganoxydans TaxID=937218 RepID=UPI002354892D|nr:cytochrome ubiquinol oxidase subunit II [Fulvimarina manganoxydans]MCK5930863.1 cytochrome ubiquinol oxidase subunit II [Fulvimarina manganoxydans]